MGIINYLTYITNINKKSLILLAFHSMDSIVLVFNIADIIL